MVGRPPSSPRGAGGERSRCQSTPPQYSRSGNHRRSHRSRRHSRSSRSDRLVEVRQYQVMIGDPPIIMIIIHNQLLFLFLHPLWTTTIIHYHHHGIHYHVHHARHSPHQPTNQPTRVMKNRPDTFKHNGNKKKKRIYSTAMTIWRDVSLYLSVSGTPPSQSTRATQPHWRSCCTRSNSNPCCAMTTEDIPIPIPEHLSIR